MMSASQSCPFPEISMSVKMMGGAILALLLAGCGGGGDIQLTPDPKPNPNLPAPNPQPGQNVYRHLSFYNAQQGSFGSSVSNSAPSFDTLSFNGVELPLVVEGIRPGRLVNVDNLTLGGTSYKKFVSGMTRGGNARYGALTYQGNNIVFHQGHLTAHMPTQSTAEYVGDVVHVNHANHEYTNGILFAHANFADKKLKLDFSKPNDNSPFVPRSLDATIDGNKFTGKTNDTTVNGAFYGDNAKDIAGHYANPTEDFQGAFGGSQR